MTRPQNKTLDRFALMCDFKATAARLDAFDNRVCLGLSLSKFTFLCDSISR